MAKFYIRCILAIIALYISVLFLSYRYIPKSHNMHSRNEWTRGRLPVRDVTIDPYRLHWDDRGKVFYKKIRNHENQDTTEHAQTDTEKSPPPCDMSQRNSGHFAKIHDCFFIFSSYFDNRTGIPEIRSIGIYKTNASLHHDPFTCHFEIQNSGKYPAYASVKAKFYEMCENHDRQYGGYIISCRVPDTIDWSPNRLRIGRGNSTQESLHNSKSLCIKSRDRNLTRRKLNFGVCVPPLYGFIKPKDLIEFVELHRILGAEIFTFYLETLNSTHSNEINRILKYYQTKNIINLVRWNLPINKKSIWYHGQSLAMNDCLYRNMADFRYIAFLDVDEILVPNGSEMTSWLDLIKHLQEIDGNFDSYSGFTIRSTFFDKSFSRKVLSSELKTCVSVNRTKNFSIFRNKMLVRPERVFEIGIHHISKPWPENAGYSALKVEPKLAKIHHYRACVQEFGIHCKSRVTDEAVPRKFGQDLANNYYKMLYDLIP